MDNFVDETALKVRVESQKNPRKAHTDVSGDLIFSYKTD